MMLVHDNGAGFDPGAAAGTSFGLRVVGNARPRSGPASKWTSQVNLGTDVLLTWE